MPVLLEILVHQEMAEREVQSRAAANFKALGKADVVSKIAIIIKIDVKDSNVRCQTIRQVGSGYRLPREWTIEIGRTRERCRIEGTISEEAKKLTRDVLIAGLGRQIDPAAQVKVRFQTDRFHLVIQAVGSIVGLKLIATIHRKTVSGQVAVEAVICRIEIAEASADNAACCIAGARNKLREVSLFFFVDDFAGQTHIASVKFFGQAQANLSTRNRAIPRIAIVAALLIMAANMEIQIIRQASTIFGIDAVIFVINTNSESNRTAAFFAGFADQVDDAARAVGCER